MGHSSRVDGSPRLSRPICIDDVRVILIDKLSVIMVRVNGSFFKTSFSESPSHQRLEALFNFIVNREYKMKI